MTIEGLWSIISKAKRPATLPSEIAVIAGVAPVNPREPNMTQKMTDMTAPPVYTLPSNYSILFQTRYPPQ